MKKYIVDVYTVWDRAVAHQINDYTHLLLVCKNATANGTKNEILSMELVCASWIFPYTVNSFWQVVAAPCVIVAWRKSERKIKETKFNEKSEHTQSFEIEHKNRIVKKHNSCSLNLKTGQISILWNFDSSIDINTLSVSMVERFWKKHTYTADFRCNYGFRQSAIHSTLSFSLCVCMILFFSFCPCLYDLCMNHIAFK